MSRPGSADWLRVQVFNVWFYAFAFCCALVAWVPARLGRPAATRAVLAWWTRRVCGAVRVILCGTIEVRGRERLPEGGPALIVSKHQSELDAILFFALYPDLGAVVMQELERYPFVGPVLSALDMVAVAVDSGPQGRTAAVIQGVQRLRSAGRPVLIYPEGTLMSLGAKERYRTGAFRIYQALDLPVTPVALSLGAIWPRREWTKQVGRTGALEFLDTLPPGLDEATFMAEIERRIEAATMALIREHADGPALAAAEDRYARGAANDA